ncbi:hypothetical protein [Roseivirga echinicomitans]|uniref:hypothetical protein n=1 Tax=Roseivirga echinicomitans TaxID=296218 RepID=UPI000A5FB1AC|nr:hypothetical protein [Roseivirga echinicomitans]
MKKKSLILTVAGMSVIVVSQFITHFASTSDFLSGALLGVGIGILFLGLVRLRTKAVK